MEEKKKSESLKEYHKEYYKRNREKLIKRATEYNKTHRDRVRETSRAYEMRRVEKVKQLEEENKKLKAELGEKIDTIQGLIREKYEEKGQKLELFKENENLKAIIEHYKKFEEGKEKLEGMLKEED